MRIRSVSQRAGHRALCSLALGLFGIAGAGCVLRQAAPTDLAVSVSADGTTRRTTLPAGSTVSQAFAAAGIVPGSLDRSQPPFYAVLRNGDVVKLTRVEESFRTETKTLPFDRQILRNESLPEGQERLVQAGANGEEELTYRAILEDGVEVSEAVVKSAVLKEPVPEIEMVGVRTSFPRSRFRVDWRTWLQAMPG